MLGLAYEWSLILDDSVFNLSSALLGSVGLLVDPIGRPQWLPYNGSAMTAGEGHHILLRFTYILDDPSSHRLVHYNHISM